MDLGRSTRFKVDNLPCSIWSAEAYDSVKLLATAISDCGDTTEDVKRCLYAVKDYPGVSGKISIDSNGDGIRNYKLKVISEGQIKTME